MLVTFDNLPYRAAVTGQTGAGRPVRIRAGPLRIRSGSARLGRSRRGRRRGPGGLPTGSGTRRCRGSARIRERHGRGPQHRNGVRASGSRRGTRAASGSGSAGAVRGSTGRGGAEPRGRPYGPVGGRRALACVPDAEMPTRPVEGRRTHAGASGGVSVGFGASCGTGAGRALLALPRVSAPLGPRVCVRTGCRCQLFSGSTGPSRAGVWRRKSRPDVTFRHVRPGPRVRAYCSEKSPPGTGHASGRTCNSGLACVRMVKKSPPTGTPRGQAAASTRATRRRPAARAATVGPSRAASRPASRSASNGTAAAGA